MIGAGLAFGLLLGGTGILVGPPAVAAEGPCVGDACDDGAWAAARGLENDVSYWGMYAGHNCTNYVAWRLSSTGIARPRTQPGNAADWAANAVIDGYAVDDVPTVGAVAQWDAGVGGYGADGHVAYVERVEDDGTVLVSEDYWRNGQQLGPLTYREVDVATVSHFIHYGDASTALRTSTLSSDGWTTTTSYLDLQPTALSAVVTDRGAQVFSSQDGRLLQATSGAHGWSASDTGLSSHATSMSAVFLDGRPYVMSVEGGELLMSARTGTGWQQLDTGVAMSGEMVAVDLGGLTPTVFAAHDGGLWRIWGDPDGWHVEQTGVAVSGSIAAAVDADGNVNVFDVRDGALVRYRLDWSGWHSEQTGVLAHGAIAATATANGPEVVLAQDGAVFRVRLVGGIWTTEPTGLVAGNRVGVVDLGDAGPQIIQIG